MKILPFPIPWDQPSAGMSSGSCLGVTSDLAVSEILEIWLSPLKNRRVCGVFCPVNFVFYILAAWEEIGYHYQGWAPSSPHRSWVPWAEGRHQQWKSLGFRIKKNGFGCSLGLGTFGSRTEGMLLSEHLPDPLWPWVGSSRSETDERGMEEWSGVYS